MMSPDFFRMSGLVIMADQKALEDGVRSIMRTLIEEEDFPPNEVRAFIELIVKEAISTEMNNIRREDI
jgi:hypothetical protein